MENSANGFQLPGLGRKRPQVNKDVSLLHLDSHNPRLPEEAQGKSEEELMKILYREFFLDELGLNEQT